MNGWLIVLVSLLYATGLFAVAWYGDRYQRFRTDRWKPIVYSLTLAVYCTSWTFFGAVGQAAVSPWSFIPIYLAPIIIMLVFWRLQARMIVLAKQENITSIADFIAARYGHSRLIAIVSTLVAALGVIPYIALQLKAIMEGYSLLAVDEHFFFGSGIVSTGLTGDTGLLVALGLAGFSILFGTRHLDSAEHHHGVMLAVAVESLVKLLAFIAVGLFVLLQVPESLPTQVSLLEAPDQSESFNIVVLTLVSMAAYFCLPRQFHVTVVENEDPGHFHQARWFLAVYLILMCLFVLPIALLGQQLLPPGVSPDTYVISLPAGLGQYWLAGLAYLGGVSAAISMVIVSVIALAIMLGNEVITPLLLNERRLSNKSFIEMRGLLLNIRRSLIAGILLLAWGFSRAINDQTLSSIGFMSFTALAQLAPGLIGGLLWQRSNRVGVITGIFAGTVVWLLLLVLPAMGMESGLSHFLMSEAQGSHTEAGMVISLTVNLLCYWLVSLLTKPRVNEQRQANRFQDVTIPERSESLVTSVRVDDLERLVARFLGENRARKAFEQQAGEEQGWLFRQRKASPELLDLTERLLARVLGTSSARIVMRSALNGHQMNIADVENIFDEASSVYTFNRELLQSSIDNLGQGLSVVDRDLRLVAWNRSYLDFFDYPEGMVCVGRHISELIRFNAERGLCGPGSPDEHVRKRVRWMEKGTAHRSERVYKNGNVIQIQGNPIPGGGFVMSFTDITGFRKVESELKNLNERLEHRVSQRTQELEELNRELLSAKQQAEQANLSRSRFFAAISHDLMQPMHAARLFSSAMISEFQEGRAGELAGQLDNSLQSAEALLKDLQELFRLETGRVSKHIETFPVKDVLEPLASEYGVMAESYQVDFKAVASEQFIRSDRTLLRRILQNFLANAFRYARGGRVMLVCRRSGNSLRIEVRDNGPGIPQQQQEVVFRAFQRLDHSDAQGLGLGLAIARGIAQILGHELGLSSSSGHGSVFSITLPVAEKPLSIASPIVSAQVGNHLAGINVLCIDNEAMILEGKKALLERWQCQVRTAVSMSDALAHLTDFEPDLLLADYHLDHDAKGLDVIYAVRESLGRDIPGIIISADSTAVLKARLKAEGIGFLAKPVKPAVLRAYMNRMVTRQEDQREVPA